MEARGLEPCVPSTSGRTCSGFWQSCGQGRYGRFSFFKLIKLILWPPLLPRGDSAPRWLTGAPILWYRRYKGVPSNNCRAKLTTHQPAGKPLIKICGVTSPEDAELAAKAGADFVGTILWQGARRAVSLQTAAKISETAERYGAQPVAVFVDEDFADIVRACKQAGIKIAQLHGRGARGSLHDLPNWLKVSTHLLCSSPVLHYKVRLGEYQEDWVRIKPCSRHGAWMHNAGGVCAACWLRWADSDQRLALTTGRDTGKQVLQLISQITRHAIIAA